MSFAWPCLVVVDLPSLRPPIVDRTGHSDEQEDGGLDHGHRNGDDSP